MDFIGPIVEFLKETYFLIVPWFKVREYEGAVLLRNGVWTKKVYYKGLHFKFFWIDEVLTCQTTVDTMECSAQSLVTSDDKSLVVESIIKFNIESPELYLLKIQDETSAIADITQRHIKIVVMNRTWRECRSNELDNEITISVRREAKKWGVAIEYVTLKSISIIRIIRLIND